MGIAPTGGASTRIGKVLEAVKTFVRTVLIGKLPADQVVFREAMVDLDVELPVTTAVRPSPNPVLVDASAGKVRLGKQRHHLLCHGIDQISANAGSGLKVRRQGWISRADVVSDVIERDEGVA